MANVITLMQDERMRFVVTFDLKELYAHIYNWLVWRKFDVEENEYTEKAKPTGKEYIIRWNAEKYIDEYSKYRIKIRWELYNIFDEEVKKGAATVKMQKGEINAYISAELVTDRQDMWVQNAFYSFMRAFYDRYIYRASIERMKGDLWKLGWELFNEFKAFMNLYKFG